MREGARSAGRSGRWRRASGTTVLAALCAGVLAPVVTAVTGGGAVAVAGVAVVGSVGGNVLASVVQQAVDRLRGRRQEAELSTTQVEAALADALETVLARDDANARLLRGELATVLREVGAAGEALRAAVREGDEQVCAALVRGLAEVGEGFAEFRFVVPQMRDVMVALQGDLRDIGEWQRHGHDLLLWQATEVRLVRERLEVVIDRLAKQEGGSAVDPEDGRAGRLDDAVPLRETGYLPVPATEVFVGRVAQIRELIAMWQQKGTSLVQVVADGGTGKTTLVCRWLDLLSEAGGRPPDVQWSFYSQGSHREAVDSTAFFDYASRTLGIDPATLGPTDRRRIGTLVAKRFAARGGILVLDGVEPLQYPPSEEAGAVRDPLLHQMLQEFKEAARTSSRRERFLVVLTTRWAIPHLGGHGMAKMGLPPLSPQEGADLLQQVRVSGTERELEFRPDPRLTRHELEAASREFSGHPLALTLLAAYLLSAEDGDLARRATIPDVEAFPESIIGYSHARRVMGAYDRVFLRSDAASWNEACRQLLRVIGLFDRPVEFELVESLCRPPITGLTSGLAIGNRYNYAVSRLRELRLISPPDAFAPELLDTHPLIREHFGRALQQESPDSWVEAHARLAYALDRSVSPAEPETVREMLTLYRAVDHGCRAGEYGWSWSVFFNRIQQDQRFTSTGKLGLTVAEVSALSGFFQQPWHEIADGVPPAVVGKVLGRSAFCLRALGRLRDASAAFEAALAHHERRGDLKAAADDANNYSVGLMHAGDLPRAVEMATRALQYAERSGATQDLVKRHVNLAWILHYERRTSEARQMFGEALRLLRELRPDQPQLLSTQGFRYAEFLLEADPTLETIREAAAVGQGLIDHPTPIYELLDQALGYAIRGRAESLLFSLDQSQDNETALHSLKHAEDLARQTGHRDALYRCLLALAAASRLAGKTQDAAQYLTELEEIIEQYGMHLYRIDCALERAWLALARNDEAVAIEFLGQAKEFRTRYAPSYGRYDHTFAELESRCARTSK